jgi:DNA helicase-2/ATP-dependent DNA helicase PcrA
VADLVAEATDAVGYSPGADADTAEEATRQADLGRLRALAAEFTAARPDDGVDGFLSELARRFSEESNGRGVNLLTYHRAKGLEFDAVFLPRLVENELPFKSGRSVAPVEEERRLLYVGITRARTHLLLSWPRDARGGRSRFVDEILGEGRAPATSSPARERRGPKVPVAGGRGPVFEALKRWRLERSKADGVPAYVVFHDSTLASIAGSGARTRADLATIPGVGPTKLDRYADDLLEVLLRDPR